MDLRQQDNIAGTELAGEVFSGAKKVIGNIRDKAKARKAQKISDAGNYWTLRPFLKGLIDIPPYVIEQVSGQGITKNAVLTLPAQGAGTSQASIISQLKILSSGGTVADLQQGVFGAGGDIATPVSETPAAEEKTLAGGFDFKKNLPYIGIGLALVVVLFFVWKRK